MQHIVDRPDLFIVRSLSRIRCYFGFDSFTAATVIKDYKMGKLFGLGVMGFDALLYLSIIMLALFYFCFCKPQMEREVIWCIIGLMVIYAGPYFIAWAHPTYHFPIMPLIAVFASAALSNLITGDATPLLTASRKRLFALITVVVAYIQVEWIVVSFDRL